jgi:hypothetical protein
VVPPTLEPTPEPTPEPEEFYVLSKDNPNEEILWDTNLGNYMYVRFTNIGNTDVFQAYCYGMGQANFDYTVYPTSPLSWENQSSNAAGAISEIYVVDDNTVRLKFILQTGEEITISYEALFSDGIAYVSRTLNLLPTV